MPARMMLLFCENKILISETSVRMSEKVTHLLHRGFTLFSVLSCVSRDFILKSETGSCVILFC